MYLAPLNYDRYFRKVFSEISIAKRFLEDFLDVNIQSIEPLNKEYKITDAASAVEFDFRCKIDNNFIIIDMQQWYKTDIMKRFYAYHSVATAIQLENLATAKSHKIGDTAIDIKNYSIIEPVITVVWLADENLGLKDDFISYIMTPETVSKFLQDNYLWENADMQQLLAARTSELLKINNKTKEIDFLAQNRLIYVFQKNIIKNNKLSKYYPWFDFAEKTRKKDNKKTDFSEFKKDEVFSEVIKRLDREKLTNNDEMYILEYEKSMAAMNRVSEESKEEGVRLGKAAMQILIDVAEQEKEKAEQEKEKAEQEKEKAEQEKENIIINLLNSNLMSADQIIVILQVSQEYVAKIQQKINNLQN